MSKTEINDTELNELCGYLTAQTYSYFPIAKSFIEDLFSTGCRPNELIDVTRWNFISENEIILSPLKSNYNRSFTSSQLSDSLLFAIENNIKPYDGLTLRQLESIIKKILPMVQVGTESKSAIAYIFRYNFVKQLHESGVTDNAIKDVMGWSSILLASSYYLKVLYSET